MCCFGKYVLLYEHIKGDYSETQVCLKIERSVSQTMSLTASWVVEDSIGVDEDKFRLIMCS